MMIAPRNRAEQFCPRTLKQAFGPYATLTLLESKKKSIVSDAAVFFATLLMIVVIGLLAYLKVV